METPRSLLTLALVLVAALACDQKTPTETRAPSDPLPTGTDGSDADGLTPSSSSAMVIPLPVNQSVSTDAPAPAFRIEQLGTGPNANFQITPSDNAHPALAASTRGLNRAGLFTIQNATNRNPAVDVGSNGRGFSLQAIARGRGGAGFFQNTNVTSLEYALSVRSAAQEKGAAFIESSRTDRGVAAMIVRHPQNTALHVIGGGNGDGPTMIIDQQIVGVPDGVEPALLVNAGPAAGHPPAAAQFNGFVGIISTPGPVGLKVGGSLAAQRTNSEFNGNVRVNGTLTKTAGSFTIDHPLDPEHKYLSHSFVESPDMMNVYNGNVILDANGRATVELPGYFEALNKDFRYQLTAIGAPGPNRYVAEGVTQNHFRIAGGRPYARVSWQVTGVRQDDYANQHRIRVEEDKPTPTRQLGEEQLIAER